MAALISRSVIVALIATSCTSALTAPITVHFEGTVDIPRQGFSDPIPPNWGFELQDGDTITGFFTIEPFDAAANAYETHILEESNFTLQIKTQTITSSQFEAYAVNDVTGDDIDRPYDSIQIGCPSNGCVSQPGSVRWWARIYAYGDTDILSGPDIPANPYAWQQFDFNEMLVNVYTSESRAYGFLAAVRIVAVVPEPSTAVLAVLGLSAALYRPVTNRWLKSAGRWDVSFGNSAKFVSLSDDDDSLLFHVDRSQLTWLIELPNVRKTG